MTAFIVGYVIFVILVIIGMNLLIRRRKNQPETANDVGDSRAERQMKHQQAVTRNAKAFVTDSYSEEELNKGSSRNLPMVTEQKDSEQRMDIKPAPIIFVLIMGAFVAILNQTLMNVALPKIMNDFNITTSTAQWLTTIYMLVNGVLVPITAFLMEKFSTRALFVGAMLFFAIGTLICAITPTFSIMLVGRVVQAMGAGIIMPLMTNVFLTIFPPEKRGAAMGMMGVAMIFAPAVGPTLSGWIVEHWTWRLLYWVVLPFAILDIILALVFLKNVFELKNPKLDIWGVIFSTIGFAGILYAFSEAGNDSWSDTKVVISLIAGIIGLIAFIWRELAMKSPMLDFRVFKYGIFSLTQLINAVVTMAMYAAMILIPVYMQNIRGFTPLESGLLMLPGAIIMGIMSPITGMLFDKVGARPLAIVGLIITAITTYQFTQLTDRTPYYVMLIIYMARMFGMSMLMMPIMTEGLNALPRRLNAHGTAMSNTVRQVAGSLGTALLVTVMSTRTTFHIANYSNNMTSSNVNFDNQVNALGQGLEASGAAAQGAGHGLVQNLLLGNVTKLATIQGINDAFMVATGFAVLGLILSLFIKRAVPPDIKEQQKKAVDDKAHRPATDS
ncbi:EmrB/QacA subfamily drug resistance transporter [Scopulibacillus daqui]|uniref:EmrB/QacA subfamily drug resistance transporter n=1 Tax=Scopulibacillus daqui TaxID=1469162 RepID=A0ABS2PVW5_9BACL|nr:DHA2 family efflux MFS transporter permease subunit [Scopulibacillus daqui]MBM7644199.1 EmrB/QacA subfamily drug resistance transporter [Scopulibacillus daqui]